MTRPALITCAIAALSLAARRKVPSAPVAPPTACAAHAALEQIDTRVAVPLLPMMANHQKQNMRDHLLAVQEIVLAAGRDDFSGGGDRRGAHRVLASDGPDVHAHGRRHAGVCGPGPRLPPHRRYHRPRGAGARSGRRHGGPRDDAAGLHRVSRDVPATPRRPGDLDRAHRDRRWPGCRPGAIVAAMSVAPQPLLCVCDVPANLDGYLVVLAGA